MTDIRQSSNYANYLKLNGWIVEKVDEVNYFIKKLPLIGNILKLQRPDKINFKTIKKLSKKYKVFQIIIEPNLGSTTMALKSNCPHALMLSNRFKLSRNPYLPSKTLQIDLTRKEKQIYLKFSKNCKYSIRKGSNFIVKEYKTQKEIEKFQKAWRKSVNYQRYVPSTKKLLNLKRSFPGNYSIFLASHNILGNIIGGAVFTRSNKDFSYYWQAFTSKEGRTSLSQYALLYQGILWAKKQGCKFFDFEGIYDFRFPNKSWLGFTHFKNLFGGSEVFYPGCYIKYNIFRIF